MAFAPYIGHELKNLFSRPATEKYPYGKKEFQPRYRGHIENDISKCILCGACMRGCPSGAITVTRPDYTWEIRPFSCVQCNNCVEVCPTKCLSMAPSYTEPGPDKTSILHRYSDEQIAKEEEKKKAIAARAAAARAAAAAKAAAAKAAAPASQPAPAAKAPQSAAPQPANAAKAPQPAAAAGQNPSGTEDQ